MTIFVCGTNHFSFARDRTNIKGLDWRNQDDLFTNAAQWVPFSLARKDAESLNRLCGELNVDWGRFDFLWSGEELTFLEFNANGQFFFLDPENQFGILDAVVDYLMS